MDKDRIKVIAIFATIFLVLCGCFYFTNGRKNIKQTNLKKQVKQQQTLINIQDQDLSQDQNTSYDQTSDSKKTGACYTVHVAGEVKYPGVYSLDKKSRIIDALTKAGGATENADLDRINLAEYIKDAEKIRVPNINERLSSNNNKDNNLSFSNLNYGSNTDGNSIENIISSSVKPNNNYNLNANANTNSNSDALNNNNNNSASQKKESSSTSNLTNINTADINKLQELPGIGPATASNIISYREQNGNFNSIEDLKAVPRIGEKTFDKLKDSITVN